MQFDAKTAAQVTLLSQEVLNEILAEAQAFVGHTDGMPPFTISTDYLNPPVVRVSVACGNSWTWDAFNTVGGADRVFVSEAVKNMVADIVQGRRWP